MPSEDSDYLQRQNNLITRCTFVKICLNFSARHFTPLRSPERAHVALPSDRAPADALDARGHEDPLAHLVGPPIGDHGTVGGPLVLHHGHVAVAIVTVLFQRHMIQNCTYPLKKSDLNSARMSHTSPSTAPRTIITTKPCSCS